MAEGTGPFLSHTALLSEIPAVLNVWGYTCTLPPSPVLSGTLNWNFEVPTTEGRRFFRCYRKSLETERILGEHALLGWVAQRGIPAPVPLPRPTETLWPSLATNAGRCSHGPEARPSSVGTFRTLKPANVATSTGASRPPLRSIP